MSECWIGGQNYFSIKEINGVELSFKLDNLNERAVWFIEII